MTNQEILDNAPEDATHIDNDGEYAKEDGYGLEYFRVTWHKYTEPVELRLLADIKRIVELEEETKHLKQVIYNTAKLSFEAGACCPYVAFHEHAILFAKKITKEQVK